MIVINQALAFLALNLHLKARKMTNLMIAVKNYSLRRKQVDLILTNAVLKVATWMVNHPMICQVEMKKMNKFRRTIRMITS